MEKPLSLTEITRLACIRPIEEWHFNEGRTYTARIGTNIEIKLTGVFKVTGSQKKDDILSCVEPTVTHDSYLLNVERNATENTTLYKFYQRLEDYHQNKEYDDHMRSVREFLKTVKR